MGCCSKEKKGKDLPRTIPIKKAKKIQRKIVAPEENVQLVSVSPVKSGIDRTRKQVEQWIDELKPEENISSIKTFDELKTSIENQTKSVSLVLFYGHYCPYSKRTVPGLRQWARTNRDRIHLYEVDVEQRNELANFYHIKTIPTVMAFNETNLLVPIWQRTANQVLTSDLSEPIDDEPMKIDEKPIEELFRTKLDRSMNFSLIVDPTANEFERISNVNQTKGSTSDEQYLVIRRDPNSPTKFVIAIINENETKSDVVPSTDDPWKIRLNSKSIDSSYRWPIESHSSVEKEYDGRLSSQNDVEQHLSSIKSFINGPSSIDDYFQHVHLPKRNELFYEKQFDEIQRSFSSDRLSTLTYQHDPKEEEVCVLFLGPHGLRGFEENRPENENERIPSKLSLLTLKSHSFTDE